MMFADTTVTNKCWNLMESFGEICTGCGCCAADKVTRYKARIAALERRIEEARNFDGWIKGLRKLQERNIREDLRRDTKMLKYYRERLQSVENKEG